MCFQHARNACSVHSFLCHHSPRETRVGTPLCVFRTTLGRVALIRGRQASLALLVRQTPYRIPFRPIDCLCCASLLATTIHLYWQVTRRLRLFPASLTWRLFFFTAFAARAPIFVLLVSTLPLFFGLALPRKLRLTVRPLRATFANKFKLCPYLPREALLFL